MGRAGRRTACGVPAAGVAGAIIANAPASYVLWREETDRLRAALPPGVEAALRFHEAAGTTGSEAYQEAMLVFYVERSEVEHALRACGVHDAVPSGCPTQPAPPSTPSTPATRARPSNCCGGCPTP